MGNLELPTNNPKQVLKMPAGSYEFGATVASMKARRVWDVVGCGGVWWDVVGCGGMWYMWYMWG